MTYFGFLFTFLIPPILILLLVAYFDRRNGKRLPVELAAAHPWAIILVLIGIALIYTTPWDNYLVANHVWWYDPELVIGITLGWVPVEEYIFFILQTTLTGMLTITLAKNLPNLSAKYIPDNRLRAWSVGILSLLWLCAAGAFKFNVAPAAYTSLLLLWALPPTALQLAFGADILWHYRKLISLAILLPTLYLTLADSLAIGLGTWTINPQKSFNIFIGALPIEELLFFLFTNILIVFGIILAISVHGYARLKSVIDLVRGLRNPTTTIDQDFSSK